MSKIIIWKFQEYLTYAETAPPPHTHVWLMLELTKEHFKWMKMDDVFSLGAQKKGIQIEGKGETGN